MIRRRALLLVLALGASALGAGCGPDTESPTDAGPDGSSGCTLPFLGDEKKDAVAELWALGPDGVSHPVKDGDTVSMIFPPQGGRVIFAGVRATNLDPCGLKITGSLRDPATKQVRIDGRNVNLFPEADGWGRSVDDDISTFANVPVCPNQWASTDLFGQTFELAVALTDRGGRKVTVTAQVLPACDEVEHQSECLCICKQGYVLGEMCAPPDAGGP